MKSLLVEIQTEEIPAGYIAPALKAMAELLTAKMAAARIVHGPTKTFGTPRRLAIMVSDVAEKQETIKSELTGPPAKIAFDASGNPTVAAQKFAEKVGVALKRLTVKKTPKGEYLSAQKTERGQTAKSLLAKIIPEMILAIPFPKTMHWADWQINFARPVLSVCVLLGDKVIGFYLGPLKSGRQTRGHSFMQPKKIRLNDAGSYVKTLEAAEVICDIDKRRKMVAVEIETAAKSVGGQILTDEGLLDTVTNLVEYPVAVAGSFDNKFLKLPREILITAMREHQKYFAVVNNRNNLMPYFVAVNNTRAKDLALVAKGHQRVIRARLADAAFFYESDLKETFDQRVEKLKRILFQAKLGTVHAKVLRVQKLAGFLADETGSNDDLKKHVLRAAFLCKADLVSQVVGEFPKLQGAMGRVYAALGNEPDDVAAAIEEHYKPTYSGGPLPMSATGAILAVADKIDSICGCFGVGLLPTGASDPYALRRQAIGLMQILLDKNFTISLKDAIGKSVTLFGAKSVQEIKATNDAVIQFLTSRMSHLLAEEGFSKDVVAATLAVAADNVPEAWQRVKALQELKSAPDFEPLAVAFKRVVNIIKQADAADAAKVDEGLFEHASEKALLKKLLEVQKAVTGQLKKGAFGAALQQVATMRDAVDAFFEGVMVLTEDAKIRANRLALLSQIAKLFAQFADFSKIST
jgi:glycyl-tRNA synthetase beta chain